MKHSCETGLNHGSLDVENICGTRSIMNLGKPTCAEEVKEPPRTVGSLNLGNRGATVYSSHEEF